MYVFLRPARLLLLALLAQSTPRQMSMGMALGVLIGLVPKGNLLAVALGILLAMLRVNLGVAASAAVATSFASVYLDPVSHTVGAHVLGHPALKSFWMQLYNTPLMPWTDFNNSVVMGSFLIGLTLILPIHWLSRPVFAEYIALVAVHVRRWRLARILLGAEWADRLGAVE